MKIPFDVPPLRKVAGKGFGVTFVEYLRGIWEGRQRYMSSPSVDRNGAAFGTNSWSPIWSGISESRCDSYQNFSFTYSKLGNVRLAALLLHRRCPPQSREKVRDILAISQIHIDLTFWTHLDPLLEGDVDQAAYENKPQDDDILDETREKDVYDKFSDGRKKVIVFIVAFAAILARRFSWHNLACQFERLL